MLLFLPFSVIKVDWEGKLGFEFEGELGDFEREETIKFGSYVLIWGFHVRKAWKKT